MFYLFRFFICLFFCIIIFSCVRKLHVTSPPIYDAEGIAIVTNPHSGGGKNQPPPHSILTFKSIADGQMHIAESYKYYGYMIKGDKFKIRYNTSNPSIYDIRFDEPVFNKNEGLVRTNGGILKVTDVDSVKGLARMYFVYEIDNNTRESSGSFYMSFKDKFQYIKTDYRTFAKQGRMYVVYYSKKNPQHAILYLDSIIDAAHNSENYLYYKAELKMNRNRYRPVIKLLSKTLNLDPVNAIALFGRGKAYYQLDDNSKAEKDFTTYIGLHPDTYDGYWYRGMIKMKRGEYSEALSDLNKAIDINPSTEPDLYYYRGMIYFSMNQYSRAVDDYSKAIEINSKIGRYYYNRAVAKVKETNQESAGDADYQLAANLGIKQGTKALNKSKSQHHDLLTTDIKKKWNKSYFSLTSENGVMPFHIRADNATMSFPYQIKDQNNVVTQNNFQETTNFQQVRKAGYTTIGVEAGKFKRGYFITRVTIPWTRGGAWDIGWGRNFIIKNERIVSLRPELTISYFGTGYKLGSIDYSGKTLIVPGQTSPDPANHSHADFLLRDAIWSFKPKLSVWLFPKHIISFKLNGGYVLPFAQITKYKVDFNYSNPNSKSGSSDTGYKNFNPNVIISNNIPLNKLYNIGGFFFSIEMALVVSW